MLQQSGTPTRKSNTDVQWEPNKWIQWTSNLMWWIFNAKLLEFLIDLNLEEYLVLKTRLIRINSYNKNLFLVARHKTLIPKMIYSAVSCIVYYTLNKPTCTRSFSFALTISLRIYLTHSMAYRVTDLRHSPERNTLDLLKTSALIECHGAYQATSSRAGDNLRNNQQRRNMRLGHLPHIVAKYWFRIPLDNIWNSSTCPGVHCWVGREGWSFGFYGTPSTEGSLTGTGTAQGSNYSGDVWSVCTQKY